MLPPVLNGRNFRQGIAERPQYSLIHGQHTAIGGNQCHRHRRDIEQFTEIGLARQQSGLDPFVFGNIAHYFRRTDHCTVPVLDRRNRREHLDPAAILTYTLGFVIGNQLPVRHARQQFLLGCQQLRREKQRNRLPHDFGGAITEYSFGRGIPTSDDSIQVFTDYRVIRSIQHGGRLRALRNQALLEQFVRGC